MKCSDCRAMVPEGTGYVEDGELICAHCALGPVADPNYDPGFEPMFPNVKVKITGQDGNAFAIIGAVVQEMRRQGISAVDIAGFLIEATSGDYMHLLGTVVRTVDCR